jgi:hypothetical protein
MSRIAPFSRLDQGKIGLPALPGYSPDAALGRIPIFQSAVQLEQSSLPLPAKSA